MRLSVLLLLLLLARPAVSLTQPAPVKADAAPELPAPHPPDRAQVLRGAYGPDRANNDLLSYKLTLRVDPVAKSIAGSNVVRFRMLEDARRIQLDLAELYAIESITLDGRALQSVRAASALFIDFPQTLRKGQTYAVTVAYHGNPIAKGRFGGMSFEMDPAGRPWIVTADEDDGCNIYWPCKDQWTDEPQEGIDLAIAVPNGLTDVSNGKLISQVDLHDGYTQWNWHVSYPINSYDVALNIGAYAHFSEVYRNKEHPEFAPLPLDFYALPEDLDKAKMQFEQAKGMLDAFEHYFGEYPFARDGYKLVQVPYSGMEHQSAVSYGNHFKNGYLERDWTGVGISPRFDFIIIHESGHEWFGNAVSAQDRCDMWIHEGWDTYLETLFVEFHYGRADALKYATGFVPKVYNKRPILTECGVAADPDRDQYFKGALMIGSLRSWLATTAPNPAEADQEWFRLIREFYQTFKYRNITTADVTTWWNHHTEPSIHHELTAFFNQYLRRSTVPTLELTWLPDLPGATTHRVLFKWQAEETGFDMPIQYRSGTAPTLQILHPTTTWQTLETPLTSEQLKVATELYYVNVSMN